MEKESLRSFRNEVNQHLKSLDQTILLYNENEFWLIQKLYEYIESYAIERRFINTMIALPLVRGLHNGVYRKYGVVKNGEHHRLPYYIHCLSVCRMLVDIDLPLSPEEEDVLLASALCHDLIEDISFPNGGREMYLEYGLNQKVYETVKLVSKRKDFTKDEEILFFKNIHENILALYVKLADRGNNVEDLYNMSIKKLKEYIGETNEYFVPMSEYGIENYPEHSTAINVLIDKIRTLTNISEVMTDKLDARNQVLRNERDQLKLENMYLREQWRQLFEEEMNNG